MFLVYHLDSFHNKDSNSMHVKKKDPTPHLYKLGGGSFFFFNSRYNISLPQEKCSLVAALMAFEKKNASGSKLSGEDGD